MPGENLDSAIIQLSEKAAEIFHITWGDIRRYHLLKLEIRSQLHCVVHDCRVMTNGRQRTLSRARFTDIARLNVDLRLVVGFGGHQGNQS